MGIPAVLNIFQLYYASCKTKQVPNKNNLYTLSRVTIKLNKIIRDKTSNKRLARQKKKKLRNKNYKKNRKKKHFLTLPAGSASEKFLQGINCFSFDYLPFTLFKL